MRGLRLPRIITYIYISLLQPLREPVGWWLCSLEKLTKTTNHRITTGGYKICPSMLNVAHTDSSVWTGQIPSSTIVPPCDMFLRRLTFLAIVWSSLTNLVVQRNFIFLVNVCPFFWRHKNEPFTLHDSAFSYFKFLLLIY